MLRLVFSPRWIMWHMLTIVAVVTCVLCAVWQWHRAGSATGSALNIGYGLQWPLFAVFFAVMWYRMLRLEVRQLHGEQPAEVPAPPGSVLPGAAVGTEPSAPAGPSPFTPRPAPPAEPITDESDPELAAYNRRLALFAERDRADGGRAERERLIRRRPHQDCTAQNRTAE